MLCWTSTHALLTCKLALLICKLGLPICKPVPLRFEIERRKDTIKVSTEYLVCLWGLTTLEELLDRLGPVKTAFHDRNEAPSCLEGTRVQLLEDISTWMKNPSEKQIYWLTGVAGTGKTTVAQSVAHMASELNIFEASFFFSHASEDRQEYKKVIPTLAYQLARYDILRSSIVTAINADMDVSTAVISVQAQRLLVGVLRQLNIHQSPRLLLVLDALDECKKNMNQVHGGDLIPILLAGLKDFPFVKVFLTSRSEPSIEAMFEDNDVQDTARTLALHHDIEETTVQSDITHYLDTELTKLRKRVPNNPDFPLRADVQELVERANTLFIYARTAVEYISDPYGRPDHRLLALLQAKPGQSSGHFGRLDDLYSQILHNAQGSRRQAAGILRTTLVTLELLQLELSAKDLAVVAGLDEDTCREYLRRISAILNYRHDTTDPVRLMHLSFPDFLSDSVRCSELPHYVIDAAEDHLCITQNCLRIMNQYLKYDICNLRDSSVFNTKVPGFTERVDAHIPGFLRYACRFWIAHWLLHIRAAGSQAQMPLGLDVFCTQHLLHWIEILSLTKEMNAVQRAMPELRLAINVSVRLSCYWV
jgi:hypothetical protein